MPKNNKDRLVEWLHAVLNENVRQTVILEDGTEGSLEFDGECVCLYKEDAQGNPDYVARIRLVSED